ncbi:MAG TPA: choice-of-anchor tandem repeat GloVer-containing protein [Terriglobales bacterium]|nr:choice-of-anchor tandem repeat GloVer-containing protein [Terriglobales bacterium]
MRQPNGWKNAAILFALCAMMTIAASAQTFTTLASFDITDGSSPYFAPLVQGTDGNFYGTTQFGGTANLGTVFKITPAGDITTLYSFCTQAGCLDGVYPYAGLVQGVDGDFYGTTSQGGINNGHGGTVFKITSKGKLTTLYSFCAQTNCTDGIYPSGGLVQGADGSFYGTTFYGGVQDAQWCSGGCGTIFKITRTGIFTTLYSFTGYSGEGSAPNSALVQGKNLHFYGTTENGGAYGACTYACGTVFEITPNGTLTTLHSFAGSPSDGAEPFANVVFGTDGSLYGTTSIGGANNAGTVFKITPGGVLTTLYSFCVLSKCADGQMPEGGLVRTSDGDFYGTTTIGGVYTVGSLFKITPGGTLTTLYSFCAQGYPRCPDGSFVYAGLLQATNGNLYGVTGGGGDLNGGTVFRLSAGFRPFVETRPTAAKVGKPVIILGSKLRGSTSVTFNGTKAAFTVVSNSEIKTTVPQGATTGKVKVQMSRGTVKSNVVFRIIP